MAFPHKLFITLDMFRFTCLTHLAQETGGGVQGVETEPKNLVLAHGHFFFFDLDIETGLDQFCLSSAGGSSSLALF